VGVAVETVGGAEVGDLVGFDDIDGANEIDGAIVGCKL